MTDYQPYTCLVAWIDIRERGVDLQLVFVDYPDVAVNIGMTLEEFIGLIQAPTTKFAVTLRLPTDRPLPGTLEEFIGLIQAPTTKFAVTLRLPTDRPLPGTDAAHNDSIYTTPINGVER